MNVCRKVEHRGWVKGWGAILISGKCNVNKVPPETGACLPCYFSQPVNSSPLFEKKYDISPTE